MTLYFDASGLTKLLLAEEGSERARELWSMDAPLVSSWISYAETAAAIAAARRARKLSRSAQQRALKQLDVEWRVLTALDVDEPIARAAASLAGAHGLRGADALHLGSAMLLAPASPVVVTWDAQLSRAALAVGLAVAS